MPLVEILDQQPYELVVTLRQPPTYEESRREKQQRGVEMEPQEQGPRDHDTGKEAFLNAHDQARPVQRRVERAAS